MFKRKYAVLCISEKGKAFGIIVSVYFKCLAPNKAAKVLQEGLDNGTFPEDGSKCYRVTGEVERIFDD